MNIIESGSPFFRHPCPGAKCACLDYEKEERKKTKQKKKLENLVIKESERQGENRILSLARMPCANIYLLDALRAHSVLPLFPPPASDAGLATHEREIARESDSFIS